MAMAVSVSVTEAGVLCWEAVTLFLFILLSFFFFYCQLADTPIPGISGGFTDSNILRRGCRWSKLGPS